MASDRRVEIRGLREATQALLKVAEGLTGPTMIDGIRRATALVLRDAKKNVPVDTGQLKSSLIADVRVGSLGSKKVTGVVGSNKSYAPYVEMGTKPHWPPLRAVETWARRHGISPFLVARSIATKGTKATKFLQNSFDNNRDTIKDIIGRAVSSVVRGD